MGVLTVQSALLEGDTAMVKNGAGQSARPRRGPSNRSRYVLRARSLKDNRSFLDRCGESRKSWNARYPSYAISEVGPCPEPETVETAAYFPMPQRLLITLKEIQKLDDDEFLDLDGPARQGAGAISAWQELVLSLCQSFWPSDDFPHTMRSVGHPARQFVGLCLLYDPRTVPEDTILAHRMRPIWVPYDPQRPQDNPFVRVKDAELGALRAVLGRAVRAGETLGPDDIRRALAQAAAAAIPSSLAALAKLDYNPGVGAWFMPIPPDITSSDWRDAEESALRIDGRHPGDFVRDRVVYHSDQGESRRAIARQLGITLRTVSDHLTKSGRSKPR